MGKEVNEIIHFGHQEMTFYIKSVIIKLFYSRPEQHGADMLDLLNACDDEKSAPAAALP